MRCDFSDSIVCKAMFLLQQGIEHTALSVLHHALLLTLMQHCVSKYVLAADVV